MALIFSNTVQLGLDVLVIIHAFVGFCDAILSLSVLNLKFLDLQLKLFNFLPKSGLHGVGVEEPLNFLVAEEEFFLDQSLHIAVTVDHRLQDVRELGVFLDFGRRESAWVVRVNRLVHVPQG